MEYTKKYFIKKFEAIPEDKWTTCDLFREGKCCALGFCGVKPDKRYKDGWRQTKEAIALVSLFSGGSPRNDDGDLKWENVWDINDSFFKHLDLGKTPKERILNKLKSL